MHATCPHCAFQAEVEAFFADDEGKRLAAVVAELPAECGRAVLAYLRLFKPVKTGLRTARAVKLSREVLALVAAGEVCKDERSGMRRVATPAMWAQGIEQMLSQRDRLTLPLDSHGYLRAVVYSIADSADAVAERTREASAKAGTHLSASPGKKAAVSEESPLTAQLKWIAQMVDMGQFTPVQAEDERDKARRKHANG